MFTAYAIGMPFITGSGETVEQAVNDMLDFAWYTEQINVEEYDVLNEKGVVVLQKRFEQVINLTPHKVRIINDENKTIRIIAPEDNPARCKQETVPSGYFNGIPLSATTFGEVYNLPEPKEGTRYIVSRLVLAACPDRSDLLVPNELVRDENGQIIGCKSLATN